MTTTEIVLLTIVFISLIVSAFTLFKLHRTKGSNLQGLAPSQVSNTLAKTLAQQSTKIDELEKQISLYKKPTTGITLKWASPREDKSAYLLALFNDFPETIHNIAVSIDPIYAACTSLHSQTERCESQKSVNLFFLPAIFGENNSEPAIFREEFIKLWLENKLKPIEITVKYTRDPTINDNYETAKIYFTRDNLTRHLRTAIQSAKTRLTIVQTPAKK